MRKEVTLVPKGKSPIDVMAELGAQTANSWMFLHRNAIEQLKNSADKIDVVISFSKFYWKAGSITIFIEPIVGEWAKIYKIDSKDIEFKNSSDNPENLFFIKLEE